ncbi:transglycosylase domain-containing protein [Anaerobacillus sp. HL2]|nr:transglycosylase domain-containing protein [Anaerobacillus sp. HL2]
MNYTKDEILEGYLNTIYYGHGAYGIEAAANYFRKSVDELNIAEISMLVGIPKGPFFIILRSITMIVQNQDGSRNLSAMVNKKALLHNLSQMPFTIHH